MPRPAQVEVSGAEIGVYPQRGPALEDRFVCASDRPAEHEMAHTGRCAGAKTDVRKCRCSCGGLLHGGADGTPTFAGASPSWSTRSSAAPDEGSAPIISEPSEARSPIDAALSEMADWLAKNPSVKEQAEAIAHIVGEQAVKVTHQARLRADPARTDFQPLHMRRPGSHRTCDRRVPEAARQGTGPGDIPHHGHGSVLATSPYTLS